MMRIAVRSGLMLALMLACVPRIQAQQGTIATVAGADWTAPLTGGTATQLPIGFVAATATDIAGNVYVADDGNAVFFKIFHGRPVQWQVSAGGNGHWYQAVPAPAGIDWATAQATAVSRSGYLATITSAQENAFVAMLAAGDSRMWFTDTVGNGVGPWLGGQQPACSPEPACGWSWVSAESFSYTNWAAGEPSNSHAGDNAPEDRLQLFGLGTRYGPYWNDYPGTQLAKGYIIEWDTQPSPVVATAYMERIAGNGQYGSAGAGGEATNLSFHDPTGVAVGRNGNIYLADHGDGIVYKLDPTGILSVFAGNGTCTFAGDTGQATSAALCGPWGLAVDAAGNVYIADKDNERVRKVDTSGVITTIAGNGTAGYVADNVAATSAPLNGPFSVAVSGTGEVYISDRFNYRIRKVDISGQITTVAGDGQYACGSDGIPATSSSIAEPAGIALDASGTLFVTSLYCGKVRKVTGGYILAVAGDGTYGYTGDGGPATSAAFNLPSSVAVDFDANIYIGDENNYRIRVVDAGGVINTYAGNGQYHYAGDGGAATAAVLSGPTGVTADASGNLYIADQYNNRVRKVTAADGKIATLAGNGDFGHTGDGGQATSARLAYPAGTAVDSSGNVYIADQGNASVRKVDSTGVISTLTGPAPFGTGPYPSSPVAIARGSDGSLYICDSSGNQILKLSGATLTVFAGTGTGGYTGDGGLATAAQLNVPRGVAIDGAGNVYIADTDNNVIRRVTAADGKIATIAGTGSPGFGGDGGPATAATLASPFDITIGTGGNIFFADTGNARVRMIDTGGIIMTVAGGGDLTVSEGAIATNVYLALPLAVSVDTNDSLYIADWGADRIYKVFFVTAAIDYGLSATPSSVTVAPGASAAYSVTITGTGGFAYPVTLSCSSGLPTGASCLFTPNPAPPGSSALTISTTASTPPGSYPVTIAGNSFANGAGSTSVTLVVSLGTPAISSLSPTGVIAGSGAFTLTVNGSNFTANSTVKWNGSSRTTTLVSSSQLTAAIPASDVLLAGTAQVQVVDTIGGSSNTVSFNIQTLSTCTTPPAGLLGWWRAEGNANDATGVNNGTAVGGTSFATGEVGQAFSFNGSTGYVSVPDSASVRPTSLTVDAWINFSSVPGFVGMIAAKTVGTGTDESFGLWYQTGTLRGGVAGSGGNGPYVGVSFTPVTGTWYHVAYTFDSASSTQALYLNGVQVGSGATVSAIQYDSHPLLIGAEYESESLAFFFPGLIDEASLYSRALSLAEIQAIYNAGALGKCALAAGPVLTSLNPVSLPAGGGGGPLSIIGSGFVSGAQAFWNGSPRTTAFVGSTQLTMTVTSPDLASPAASTIRVQNPGSAVSNSLVFFVSPPVTLGTNLLLNPGAEAGAAGPTGYETVFVPGWAASGGFTVASYNTSGGFPLSTDPGPSSRGTKFFSGGNNNGSSATQVFDLTSLGTSIDAGGLGFVLAGYLGGFSSQNDNATLTVTFKNASGGTVGSGSIGPVTAADRNNLTGLLGRQMAAGIPVGARSAQVVLLMSGGPYNDGYADNLLFGIGTPYAVGDTFPKTSDTAGQFGDQALQNLDLLEALRAVTSAITPPAPCSDRFDAMDSYPADSPSARGGDASLDINDLVVTLGRIAHIDPSTPVRISGTVPCLFGGRVGALRSTSRGGTAVFGEEALLDIGTPQALGAAQWRVPVYLEPYHDLDLKGISYSVSLPGFTGQMSFTGADAGRPSLLDAGISGTLAMAWLNGLKLRGEARMLLGYVQISGWNSAPVLRVNGVVANASNGRLVRVYSPRIVTATEGERQ